MGVCFADIGVMTADFGVFSFFAFSFLSFDLAADFLEDVALDGVSDLEAWVGVCFTPGASVGRSAFMRLANWFSTPVCFRFRSPFTVLDFASFVCVAGMIDADGVVISTSESLSESLSELEGDCMGAFFRV